MADRPDWAAGAKAAAEVARRAAMASFIFYGGIYYGRGLAEGRSIDTFGTASSKGRVAL